MGVRPPVWQQSPGSGMLSCALWMSTCAAVVVGVDSHADDAAQLPCKTRHWGSRRVVSCKMRGMQPCSPTDRCSGHTVQRLTFCSPYSSDRLWGLSCWLWLCCRCTHLSPKPSPKSPDFLCCADALHCELLSHDNSFESSMSSCVGLLRSGAAGFRCPPAPLYAPATAGLAHRGLWTWDQGSRGVTTASSKFGLGRKCLPWGDFCHLRATGGHNISATYLVRLSLSLVPLRRALCSVCRPDHARCLLR